MEPNLNPSHKWPTGVTYFTHLKAADNPEYIFLQTAIDRIRDGASRDLVEKLRYYRAEGNHTEADVIKRQLPCICFSGRFSKRANEAIIQHSGYVCLDFDKLPDPQGAKRYLATLPFVYAAWISPSGTGVKALVRIPKNATAHRGHFTALQEELGEVGMELDKSGKDVARICFESYDPDIFINEEAEVYERYSAPDDTPPQQKPPVATDFGLLNKCVNMIRRAKDGEKHNILLKAATLAGGYIAAGKVSESDAIKVLEDEIRDKPGVHDVLQAQRTISDGIRYGKEKPIYEQTAEEQPAPKTETTHGIKFLSSVWDTMQYQFKNGKARGETTHLEPLDNHFTWKKGDFTLITGRPNSGKSEFILQLMLYKSVLSGWKWAVFSPESYPAEEFYDTLIHALVGKSCDKSYANVMKPNQYAQAANFIANHFYYIYPEERQTIEEVESNFEYCLRELGVNGVLIDPFNQLSREFKDRDDQYLEEFLTSRKRFALLHNIPYIMVIHPKAMKKNKDGEYDPVDFYDLSGGAMWANKTDNLITVHRPYQSTEPANTTVEIHVKKIKKQRLVGIPGTITLSFKREHNRYYFLTMGMDMSPLGAINSDADGIVDGPLKMTV
ncbi:hypothetical protein DYU11_20255 [Fibrisoma montanum]|uniref:SF4 helicase domain-containing protein n=1 Tax=Fibrisoma montanum TaxID=2305895 RepID=A0A418M3I3_9BACT|nr:BT4734/BF3469 family protein [Fibrisoma montanum]RIV20386.1 hypothetical protein DYU11_20255 [Fibrisoma montanum]